MSLIGVVRVTVFHAWWQSSRCDNFSVKSFIDVNLSYQWTFGVQALTMSQIQQTLWSILIRHRSVSSASDWCDLRIFAIYIWRWLRWLLTCLHVLVRSGAVNLNLYFQTCLVYWWRSLFYWLHVCSEWVLTETWLTSTNVDMHNDIGKRQKLEAVAPTVCTGSFSRDCRAWKRITHYWPLLRAKWFTARC